jgi:hypothetical protein
MLTEKIVDNIYLFNVKHFISTDVGLHIIH